MCRKFFVSCCLLAFTFLHAETVSAGMKPAPFQPKNIPVDLAVSYTHDDASIGWITDIMLIPKGAFFGHTTPAYHANAKKLSAYFPAVKPGRLYTVYSVSRFQRKALGVLDLSRARGLIKSSMTVFIPTSQQ